MNQQALARRNHEWEKKRDRGKRSKGKGENLMIECGV